MAKARIHVAGLALTVLVLGLSAPAMASVVTVPAGLAPGAPYRLAFVTSAGRDALSSNIADYNAFVTAAANNQPALAALGTTWSAIASTTTVDARDNTDTNPLLATGVPIYRLDGVKIANDNADLWDDTILSPLNVSEAGSPPLVTEVWTGTYTMGVAHDGGALGQGSRVVHGLADATDRWWYIFYAISGRHPLSLYGISGPLTAPVPLPAALPLFAAALAGLAGLGQRKGIGR